MTTPYGSRFVPGDGPIPCDLMMIGEGPGARENETGRPFDGASGKLLDRILFENGIPRDSIYVTNLVKYHVPGDEDPSKEDINRDFPILCDEIARVQPRFIGTLGRIASRHFTPWLDLEWAHGLPLIYECAEKAQVYGIDEDQLVVQMPMYHPAFGLHSAEVLPWVADDIHQFALLAKGKLQPREDHDIYPKPKYKLLRYALPPPPSDNIWRIYIDTEGSAAKPWGLSFSWQPGEAFVILATNKILLKRFAAALALAQESGVIVVLHNSLHDLSVLRAMGIEITNFIDTMVRSYHLCLEPQGLKPLARRHAGMQMQSYEEVIGPAARRKAEDYLSRVTKWLSKQSASESQDLPRTSPTRRKARRLTSPRAGKRSRTISPKKQRRSSKR